MLIASDVIETPGRLCTFHIFLALINYERITATAPIFISDDFKKLDSSIDFELGAQIFFRSIFGLLIEQVQ